MKQYIKRITQFSLAFALSIVPTFALGPEDVAQSMGTMWNYLGAMFSFQFVQNDPFIQQGILKFLFFILLLAVIQYGAKKAGFTENKLSGIIAFCLSAITVWFTPNVFLGHLVVALAVPLAVIGGLTYLAMWKLKGNWLLNIFGFCIMLFNIVIVNNLASMFEQWDFGAQQQIVNSTFDVAAFIIFILTVVKGFQTIFSAFGSGDGTGFSNPFKNMFNSNNDMTGSGPNGTSGGGPKGSAPLAPQGVNGYLLPNHEPGTQPPLTTSMHLWWLPNSPADNVAHYLIEAQVRQLWKWTGVATHTTPIGTVDANAVPTEQHPFEYHFNQAWNGRSSIFVRVIAVSQSGKKSWAWRGYIRQRPSDAPSIAHELTAQETAMQELRRLDSSLHHFLLALPPRTARTFLAAIPYAVNLRREYTPISTQAVITEHTTSMSPHFGADLSQVAQFANLATERLRIEGNIARNFTRLARRGL